MASASEANTPDTSPDGCLTIIQLSDSHLRQEADGELLGMNTQQSLDAVIALARKDAPQPDLVVASGDISQDGSEQSYRSFKARADVFQAPMRWLPGNHDERSAMAAVTADSDILEKVVRLGGWQLIFLDSLVAGRVYGSLSDAELKLLDDTLQNSAGVPTVVFLHHHPIDIQSRWLDAIGLKNRDVFFAVTDKYPHVKAIVWGHIHQELDQMRNGVRLLATPSTCVQFLPKSRDFAVDNAAPGYRWLKLFSDGRVETAVSRADHIEFKVDYSSKGY